MLRLISGGKIVLILLRVDKVSLIPSCLWQAQKTVQVEIQIPVSSKKLYEEARLQVESWTLDDDEELAKAKKEATGFKVFLPRLHGHGKMEVPTNPSDKDIERSDTYVSAAANKRASGNRQ